MAIHTDTSGSVEQPSARLRSAWAKHGHDDDLWLPLVQHSLDSAAVAGQLWTSWLPQSTRNLLAGEMPEIEARTLACWLAAGHDSGKVSPAFSIQVPTLAALMRDAGLDMPYHLPNRRETPHSLVSYFAITEFLVGRGWNSNIAKTYSIVAGGHHGVPPESSQTSLKNDSINLGGPEWAQTRSELLERVSQVTGANHFLESWSAKPLTPQQQVLWTAFVIMADWIASNDKFFPLGEARDAEAAAAEMWARLALPPPWSPPTPPDLDELIAQRFGLASGTKPRPMQRAVADAAQSMSEPGLMIVEAQMGSGKTEAALAGAEYIAAKFGQGGVFFALPTMATSNAMFSRVLSWIELQNLTSTTSTTLAHGKSALNDEYAGLLHWAHLNDIGADDIPERDSTDSTIVAHYWLSGRKKGVLANFTVGSIDQVLFGGLKSRHLALRHLALTNKVVIVDEIHAADHYMRHYLLRVLEWLGAYNVPTILMSATLPSAQRRAFVAAYQQGQSGAVSDDTALRGEIGYPAITTVCGIRISVATSDSESSMAAEVQVHRIDDELSSLVEKVTDLLLDGGCVGIVRNTVVRAQEAARALRMAFPDDVVLLHSRFLAQHRADLEDDLIGELGRNGTRPHRRIVVGTQVIEQSLDIDFDVMFSDLAPTDLLLQRIGRLHRHSRERPTALTTPQLFLTGVVDWSTDPPEPITASSTIYGSATLLRTLAVLDSINRINLPRDIPSLVEETYDPKLIVRPSWSDQFNAATDNAESDRKDAEMRADAYRLRSPYARKNLLDWVADNVGDAEDNRGQAKVRDSEEGVEVIVTQRIGSEVRTPEQCGGVILETEHCPSDERARIALTSTISLPMSLTGRWNIDATLQALEAEFYPGWQDSKWLRGELVLELDESMRTTLASFSIEYRDGEGLLVSKIAEQELP